MIRFKRRKEPKSSLLTANISDVFDFSSQINYNNQSDCNYKSIFSYQVADLEEDDESNPKDHKLVIFAFRVLLVLLFPILGWFSLKIVTKNRKMVVYRCGRLLKISNPGVTMTIPFIDTCRYIDTDLKECEIKHASCTTKDQGLVELDCSVRYRVLDPAYLLTAVTDWRDHVVSEIRHSVTTCVKSFHWSDFGYSRNTYDLQNEIQKSLNSKDSTKGLEIKDIIVSNVTQGKPPESPIDVLKKINFRELGRHLSNMTPMFINSAMPPCPIINDPTGSAPTGDQQMPGNRNLDSFFDKLEQIKQMAFHNSDRPGATMKTASPCSNSATGKDSPGTSQPPANEMSPEDREGRREVEKKFAEVVKQFIRHNLDWSSAQTVLREGNLDSLFSGETEKRAQISAHLAQMSTVCALDAGPILFVTTRYFSTPAYFHFCPQRRELLNGKVDNFVMLIDLD